MPHPRTLLFLSQAVAPIGGVQRWLDQLATGLAQYGWRTLVGLAWGRHHDPAAFEAAHPSLETLRLDGRSGTRAGRLLAVERAIRRTCPAVVVPVTLADPFEVLRELKSAGSDVRLFVGAFELSTPMLLEVRHYAPIVDRALGTSRLASRLLVEAARLPHSRVDYVPPGFERLIDAPRTPAGERLRIGLVGRLDADKRPLDMLGLLADLDARGVAYDARVVGDGALRSQLVARAAPWIRAGRLHVHAPLDTEALARDVWPALDVVVHFSPAEGGLPNTLAEALLHGVAVVSSDFRGRACQDFVRHEQTGLVFPIGDLETAARHVARLARDGALRSRLAAAGKAEVETQYSVPAMLSGWNASLEAALSGQPTRGRVAARETGERDRLATWFGRSVAERARHVLRRGFRHPDASEWPHYYRAARPHEQAASGALAAAPADGTLVEE